MGTPVIQAAPPRRESHSVRLKVLFYLNISKSLDKLGFCGKMELTKGRYNPRRVGCTGPSLFRLYRPGLQDGSMTAEAKRSSQTNRKGHVSPSAPVVTAIRQGKPTPAQAAAWDQLWTKLLVPSSEDAPDPGTENRGGNGGETGG